MVEGGAELVPAALQIGLTLKNVAKTNLATSLASVAVDGVISSYKAIKQARSDDPDEKITKTEAITEIGQAFCLSSASVAVSTGVGIGVSYLSTAVISTVASTSVGTAIASGAAAIGGTAVGSMALAAIPFIISGVAVGAASYGVLKLWGWGFAKFKNWSKKQRILKLCQELGLKIDGSDSEIESSFRKKALRCHPDKIGGDGNEFKKLKKIS